MKVRLNKAFTLVELLVVIAIIAILAAILFPIFLKAKESAKLTWCQSNLRQLALAMQMYIDDSNGRFPPWAWHVRPIRTERGRSPSWIHEKVWRDAIFPYCKSYTAMYCPARPREMSFGTDFTAAEAAEHKYGVFTVGYGLGYCLTRGHQQPPDTGNEPSWPPVPSACESDLKSARLVLLMADSGRAGYSQGIAVWDYYGLAGLPAEYYEEARLGLGYNKGCVDLHNQGGNCSFVDGHIEFIKFKRWQEVAEVLSSGLFEYGDRTGRLYSIGWERAAAYIMWPSRMPNTK